MTATHSTPTQRILAEGLVDPPDPLALLLDPRALASAAAVAGRVAAAVLDLPAATGPPLPSWLAPHQVSAARRLLAILARHHGALLADAAGLGKSYVALAVARAAGGSFALIVPGVLRHQWSDLLTRLGLAAPIVTHETLSDRRFADRCLTDRRVTGRRLLIVDEAHRFRHTETRRYGALARLAVGRELLLVTATPVHNRLADLCQLLRLFLRDDALTALGIPSLRHAARGAIDAVTLQSVVSRLVVARSRSAVRAREQSWGPTLVFPARSHGLAIRVGPAPDNVLTQLVNTIRSLALGRHPAALRLLLLARLASSLPAFRATMWRLQTLAALAHEAAAAGRRLKPRDLDQLCPRGDGGDVQLALLPLLLEPTNTEPPSWGDPVALQELASQASAVADPKADALADLLSQRSGKSIVFTAARATVRHLASRLGRQVRIATLDGAGGRWSGERVSRGEVLRAFAPLAQGARRPAAALATDVLLATDLASEGLNLQDAVRVIHYDLPWTPARLAQRVGRVDRLGSPHREVEVVTFLPSEPLARAIAIERRLCAKAALQRAAGAAGVEHPGGVVDSSALDWCDRLQPLADAPRAPSGAWTHVAGPPAVVLCVRLGGTHGLVELIVVERGRAKADPERATTLLRTAVGSLQAEGGRAAITGAVCQAAPLLRERLSALAAARWRVADRDTPGRRLVPWVLAAGRRAMRRSDARRLARLDALVGRLTRGLSAGEELRLADLLQQRAALTVDDVLSWHERLPQVSPESAGTDIELIAAVAFG